MAHELTVTFSAPREPGSQESETALTLVQSFLNGDLFLEISCEVKWPRNEPSFGSKRRKTRPVHTGRQGEVET